jgi:hypothetical protein
MSGVSLSTKTSLLQFSVYKLTETRRVTHAIRDILRPHDSTLRRLKNSIEGVIPIA